MAWTEEQAGKMADFVGLLLSEIQSGASYDIVSSAAEYAAVATRRATEGLVPVAIGNIGTPMGSYRVTFIPEELDAAKDRPGGGCDLESGQVKMTIEEFLAR